MKIEELDVVALTHDIPKEKLKAGDRGTIVMVYNDGEAYEVELIAKTGYTIAVLTLYPADVRQTQQRQDRAGLRID